jgi:putative component of toxin-antitoxin plasmid stabilization module
MYTIKLTPAFEAWMAGIKDKVTRIRLARRLDKAQRGNLGDIKSLGGGGKSSQAADIGKAAAIAATIEE